MVTVPVGYGLGLPDGVDGLGNACQLLAILLWMHNGLGYIYGQCRVYRLMPAPKGMLQKDANMSIEQFIENEVKSNDVVLFMKGTPQFPQCGFSGQVVQILDHVGVGYKGLNVLESADLRNGIKTYSNWPTIPQLYVKGEFVGGCDIIREMFQAGELQQLLADKGVAVTASA
ncbi:MAG: Glutaredoxin-related protein [Bradyrhizobium sp.]|jgi:monothiol glutaredoxin|nr:Glutaredoxin-related protein [Bradyrhizobium sp.]